MCLIGVNVKVPTSSYFVFIGCNIKVQSNRETFKLLRCTVENRLIEMKKMLLTEVLFMWCTFLLNLIIM